MRANACCASARARGGRSTRARRWPSNASPGRRRRYRRRTRARLDADVADAVRDFIARHPFALGPAETNRLIAAVGAMGDGASIDDVRVAVATAYGGRLSDAILRTTAENLARRIASVRRRHVAAHELPGHALRRAVAQRRRARRRGAQRDAGRDGAGGGYSRSRPTARRPTGWTWCRWVARPTIARCRCGGGARSAAGAVAAAGLLAILLVLVGGPSGLLSLPLAFAPAAAAIAPAALLGEPVGCRRCRSTRARWRRAAILALAVTLARRRDRSADGGRA